MGIRLSGLTSGMDTESIVNELMKAQTMKKTKVENKKTKLEWTQDKWKNLNTKLYSFYTDKVSNMRFSSAYNTKKVSVSDSSVVGITGKSSAINGSYTLEVNKIASANYVTSGKINLADTSTGAKVTAKTKISELAGGSDLVGQQLSISYKGKSTLMTIDAETTIEQYVTRLRNVGLSASFDEAQQRLFMSSGTSGADSNFTISLVSDAEKAARQDLRNLIINGSTASALTTEQIDTVDALIYKIKNSQTGTESYTKAVDELKTYATTAGVTGADVDTYVSAYKTASQTAGDGVKLAALGMTSVIDGRAVGTAPAGMAVITGEDSEIVLNGAILNGSETTMNVNGLNIELKGLTNGSKVTFSVSNDVDAVYDSIKSFLTEYNSLLDEMNKAYHATPARGYDPLTDEEKESMTDNQIELWENKIKDSLLRNDTTLGGIISSMKSAMMSAIEIDGKSYSLSSLGIMTSTDYTEYGKLHIYGDKDDSTYADKTDKLRKKLEEDPEFVTKLMSGISQNLYDTMQKKMATSTLSSALTFYNDKEMKKQVTSYETSIKEWASKLKTIEDRYYKQFTAMEKAMASMQSAQNSFASMLG